MVIEKILGQIVADGSAAMISVDFAEAILVELCSLRVQRKQLLALEPIYQAQSVGGLWSDVTKDNYYMHETWRIVYAQASPARQPSPRITEQDARKLIKEIFMEHGFTIKDGQSDLKPYVYDAALALLNKLNDKHDSVGG